MLNMTRLLAALTIGLLSVGVGRLLWLLLRVGLRYAVILFCARKLNTYELSSEKEREVESKINETLKWTEEEPKSLKWKMRTRLGTKKKWYREVENIPEL
jgi:hypothetical protein